MTVYRESQPGASTLLEALSDSRLLGLAHDAIVIQQLPQGTITFWSPSATQMYGWTAEEALGRTSHELLQSRFPVPRNTVVRELLDTGRWQGQVRQRRRSGRKSDHQRFVRAAGREQSGIRWLPWRVDCNHRLDGHRRER